MKVGEILEFIDSDGWAIMNIRVEIEEGIPTVSFWYGDEYTRCGPDVSDLPRFIALMQAIYDQYKDYHD